MMERCIRNQQYPTSSRQILSWQSLGSIISVRVSLLYLPPLFILQESIGSLVEEPCRLGNRWRAGRYADDFHAVHRVLCARKGEEEALRYWCLAVVNIVGTN